jgi:hypothetical protein
LYILIFTPLIANLAHSILISGGFLIFNAAINASQPPHVDRQAHPQAHPDNMGIVDIAMLCRRHSGIKMGQDPHLDHSGANAKIRKMLLYACICYFNFDILNCLSSLNFTFLIYTAVINEFLVFIFLQIPFHNNGPIMAEVGRAASSDRYPPR